MLDRELEARRDLGTTEVRRPVAAALVGALLLICVAPSAVQTVGGGLAAAWRTHLGGLGSATRAAAPAGGPVWSELVRTNALLRVGLHDFELALEDTSPVRAALLPWAQWVETAIFATGNRKVLVGRDGWLYFKPDLESLLVPGFLEPRSAPIGGQSEEDVAHTSGPQALRILASFAETTRRRGIDLVVLVVPGKVAIEFPPASATVLHNASFERFAEELRSHGVTVLDATPILAAERRARGAPLYLHTDTHWRPEGLAVVARSVADTLRPRLPATLAQLGLTRRPVAVEHSGDLWRALRLPARSALYREERATIERVVTAAGEPLRPAAGADLLVMGDSFTNIYADATMGWGDSAGLGEQIAFELGRPFDRLAITGGGPAAALRALTPERLTGKRVVVFQLVAFELLSGEWPTAPAP